MKNLPKNTAEKVEASWDKLWRSSNKRVNLKPKMHEKMVIDGNSQTNSLFFQFFSDLKNKEVIITKKFKVILRLKS